MNFICISFIYVDEKITQEHSSLCVNTLLRVNSSELTPVKTEIYPERTIDLHKRSWNHDPLNVEAFLYLLYHLSM